MSSDSVRVPVGRFCATTDDAAAAESRRRIAEMLRNGDSVSINASGTLHEPGRDVNPSPGMVKYGNAADGEAELHVPRGKLAMEQKYWYERLPELLAAEKQAMARHFPGFKLDTLSDGRMYWVGNVNPRGAAGGVWTLQAIYNHDHPSNSALFGSSVRVYSIKPDLNELSKLVPGALPHVLRDQSGNLYMCTARQEDVAKGKQSGESSYEVTSAASSLAWGVKWIWLVEGWLQGEISTDDIMGHVY